MKTIEERYKSALNVDIDALNRGNNRKFIWLLSTLGVEFAHGMFYKRNLNKPKLNEEQSDRYDNTFGELKRNNNVAVGTFGTPIWDNLILEHGNGGKNLRIDMVLIDVSMTKNIVKTAIQGMSGTVKEYISDGDYTLNIKGALFGEDNLYPEDDVLNLIEICKRQEAIPVLCGFLQHMDIDSIVIESYSLEAKEAQGNVQFFEINAVSDTPIELVLTGNNENTAVN